MLEISRKSELAFVSYEPVLNHCMWSIIDQLTYDVIYLHSDRPLLINAGQKQYTESVQKYKNPLQNIMQNWFCFNFEILCSL